MADATARHARPDAHFLLVSSLAAREPALSAYAATKRAGEDALSALGPQQRRTIVRAPAVYGPGDRRDPGVLQSRRARLVDGAGRDRRPCRADPCPRSLCRAGGNRRAAAAG